MELYCKFRLCATHHVVSSTPNPPPPQQIDRLDREKPASLPKWKKKKERNIPSDARSKLIMNKLCHLTLLVQSYIPRIYGGNKPQRHAKRGEGKKKTFKITSCTSGVPLFTFSRLKTKKEKPPQVYE